MKTKRKRATGKPNLPTHSVVCVQIPGAGILKLSPTEAEELEAMLKAKGLTWEDYAQTLVELTATKRGKR